MFKRIRNMHPVTGIVIGVVATLVLSGTAMAITDTTFTYSTVQTGYLMIGPGDLVPENNGSADDYSLAPVVISGTFACFTAPVHLPQGARMTSVRTSYRSDAATNPGLLLERFNPVTGAHDYLIAPRSILDDSDTLQYVNDVIPANLRLVTNSHYLYSYRPCVGSGDVFYGARIAYQYYTAGD